MENIISIKKLEESFYKENPLKESLHDGSNGDIEQNKIRGYGVLIVRINEGMLFGIPLRSHISHHNGYITIGEKGLDYTKSVIIKDLSYISSESFKIPQEQYIKIKEKNLYIRERFEKYVKKYIKAVNRNDKNILKEYKYSTLQNYHKELGI